MWRKQTGKIKNLRFIIEDYIYYPTFYNYVITTATRGTELCSRLGLACYGQRAAGTQPAAQHQQRRARDRCPLLCRAHNRPPPVPNRTHAQYFRFQEGSRCLPAGTPAPAPAPGAQRSRAALPGGEAAAAPATRRCVLG